MARLVLLTAAVHVCVTIAVQPLVPKPPKAPLRDLRFGDINFLHTTDTHGWHAGHLLEGSYSGDWGDYIDFTDRLREKTESAGQDLLVIDTGDRIEGNGLYDGDEPRGQHTFDIFTNQHVDIICSGNHELYKTNSSQDEVDIVVPAYHESYIASNLDVLNHDGEWVPLAQRYRKFTTKVLGLKVMAFGFIFNFERSNPAAKVILVEEAIQQDWFKQAIQDDDVDLFIVIGHAGLRSEEFRNVFKAIRKENENTPIQFFGGHVHIRDAIKFDSRAYGIASGRFMETIGFQSIDGIKPATAPKQATSDLVFSRRYIDNNLHSYYHHTGLNETTFHSAKGQAVSKKITKARKDLKLDTVFGCAPQDYWMQRVPFPSEDSIFTLLNDTILPEIVVQADRADKSRLILTNTGAIRFDIFKGRFTIDSTFTVSPFTSGMQYIRDVPLSKALKLLEKINNGKTPTLNHNNIDITDNDIGTRYLGPPEQYGRMISNHVEQGQDSVENNEFDISTSTSISKEQSRLHDDDHHHNKVGSHNTPETNNPTIVPGYVTTDGIDTEGDDTIHKPIPFYYVPNVMQSLIVVVDDDDDKNKNKTKSDSDSNLDLDLDLDFDDSPSTPKVDLIFNEFLQPNVLENLHKLGTNHTKADVLSYLNGESMTGMIVRWISKNWGVYCEGSDRFDEKIDDKIIDHINDENGRGRGRGRAGFGFDVDFDL